MSQANERPETGPRSDTPMPAGAGRPEIASFLLRFTQDAWQAPAEGRHLRWRGHIRHVQSESETHFTDFADAVAFMQAELARLTLASVADAPEPDRADLLRESLRIWERFASDYAEALGGAVSEGLERSERYQRQALELFEQTLGAWNPMGTGPASPGPTEDGSRPPSGAAERELGARLAAIEARLGALTRAIEAMTPPSDPDRDAP